MKAITTKFHGPTNVKGSRYSASDEDGNRVILSSDHSLNSDNNHARAAQHLCEKMGWQGQLVGGGIKHGMVWVFVKNSPRITPRYTGKGHPRTATHGEYVNTVDALMPLPKGRV